MTFSDRGKTGISNQRGFWLRCFLGGMICILFGAAGSRSLFAQLDIPGPERLTHVEGVIVNDAGHPVAGIEITLMRDQVVAYRTQTGKSGEFQIEHVAAGTYMFRVKRSVSAPAERQILITNEVVTALERKKLYVILGPGACQDACSSVLTSKKEFDRVLRRNRRGH